MNIIFTHKIDQYRSIRTGAFPMPDDGMVSFLGRVNQNKNLEILQPNLEQDLVQWIGNHEDYIEFKFIEKEMVSEVFDVFNTYKNTILENADKIVNQEYSSLKLEQQARTFAALLRKTVDINNVKLFYSSEQNRTAFAYGFSFIDAELIDFAASINPDYLADEPNLTSPIIASAVEENEFPAVVTPLPPNVKKNRNNKHPWWINTIRSINWFAWKYWWLVWLLFILSFLLLYFFCPSKKKTSNSTCNELNHIHKNIDTLNGGLLYCCDCRREIPPIENDSIPALDSNEIFLPADFILITYQFDASGGKDLDTRTNVESPTRGDVIGYCKPSRSTSNIVWSGDNTAYGVESVYVDINKYGSTDLIKILCKAFWYSQRNSGNMSLDIRAYKGGAMQRDRSNHYQFINVGGEQVGDVISFPKNIIMKGANCMTGEIIGTVKYNRANQSLSFE